MNDIRIKKIIESSTSPFDQYCDGYGNPGSSGNGYILGPILTVGKVRNKLLHEGSNNLDQINAFDRSEVEGPYLGQINMTYVSSFCGLNGLVWGYDLVKVPNLFKKNDLYTKDDGIKVYDIEPLQSAMYSLLGTVNDKHFPFIPGSHVPCAGKKVQLSTKGYIFCGIAMGIPKDRSRDAILLMEDVGEFEAKDAQDRSRILTDITNKLVMSIKEIGNNQGISYEECFVGVKDLWVDNDETGCALVAAPYFELAKKAIPDVDSSKLLDINLNDWEHFVKKNYLSNIDNIW